MGKKSVTIVGAGLAGLTAAINLSRQGYEVLVLDKEKRHGGRAEFRPDGAASPFDFQALQAYTGIDIMPVCKPIESMTFSVFGKRIEMTYPQEAQMYMVERGPRSGSLDTFLLNMAKESGVKFEWGFAIKSPSDVSGLPEGSIIATGLDVQGFEAMGIPYVPFWGWFAKGTSDDKRTLAWAYIDDFTVDYGFTTLINGVLFPLLFQREKPLRREDKEKFEKKVYEDGVELKGWKDLFGGAAPHRTLTNPVLFKNNMIVAGTLAGVMEPLMNFGMLGAMISGKIAAIAVTDRGKAYEEFLRLTSFFRKSLLAKRMLDKAPIIFRKALWQMAASAISRAPSERFSRMFGFVPGYLNF